MKANSRNSVSLLDIQGPVENVEFVESGGPQSTNSTLSTPPRQREHPFPPDSVLADFVEVVRDFSEAPDSFAVAPMLAVCGRLLTPKSWWEFGGRKYPNLFQFVVAPPGVRKSTAFKPAIEVASRIFTADIFHEGLTSDVALFRAFTVQPHRLQLEPEANPIVANWSNQGFGREVAHRYLKLYDGDSWRQTFKNHAKDGGDEIQIVDCATMSLAFAGTFNCCRFSGLDVQSGLRRRFGYYVAETPARFIEWPSPLATSALEELAEKFAKLENVAGQARFAPGGQEIFGAINRRMREKQDAITGIDDSSEAKQNQLSEAPSRILKLALIFEALRWANSDNGDPLEVRPDTLEFAEAHQLACLDAASALDTIGRRAELMDLAERIVAQVVTEKYERVEIGEDGRGHIRLARAELTRDFAPNARRGMTAHKLHHEVMPLAVTHLAVTRAGEGNSLVYWFPLPDEARYGDTGAR